MAITDNEAVMLFFENKISKLMREEYGVKGFLEVRGTLIQLHDWIAEMINIIDRNPNISVDIQVHVLNYVNAYNDIAKEITAYNLDKDTNNFNIRKQLVMKIQNWMKFILFGYNLNNDSTFKNEINLLTIYNTLKIEDVKDFSAQRAELENIKNELLGTKKEYSDLLLALRQKAASETTMDYAAIFERQSASHSSFSWKPFKVGGAENWLVVAVVFISIFIVFLHKINDALPVNFELKSSEITVQLLTRLVVISFFIYIVTLVIKQYSVQKHLGTLNRHRQNVLNSFNLFINSIDKEDTQTRNALMMEVAKAIYESGQTGYVTSREGEGSSSLIEMTKYITPGKSS